LPGSKALSFYVCDEEKRFFSNTDTCGQYYKTFYSVTKNNIDFRPEPDEVSPDRPKAGVTTVGFHKHHHIQLETQI
jgi:hypothetical protein